MVLKINRLYRFFSFLLAAGGILVFYQNCSNGGFATSQSSELSKVVVSSTECEFNGNKLSEGESVTAYLSSVPSNGVICRSEERVCKSGVLTGTYLYALCDESPSANSACLFMGMTIPDGQQIIAYKNSSISNGENCQSEIRVCHSGKLSGSYESLSCSAKDNPSSTTATATNPTPVSNPILISNPTATPVPSYTPIQIQTPTPTSTPIQSLSPTPTSSPVSRRVKPIVDICMGHLGIDFMEDGRIDRFWIFHSNYKLATNTGFGAAGILDLAERFNWSHADYQQELRQFASLLDMVEISYKPFCLYPGTGSDHGINLVDLANGEMGTAYDWTVDSNVSQKGPMAVQILAETKALAARWSLKFVGYYSGGPCPASGLVSPAVVRQKLESLYANGVTRPECEYEH